MIASGFLSSSAWNFEDPNNPFADGAFVLVDDTEDNAIDSVFGLEQNSYPPSPVHSSGSSEDCDFLPLVDDDTEMLCVSEFGPELINSLNFDDLDWVAVTSNETIENGSTEITNTYSNSIEVPRKRRRRSKKKENAATSKSWSRMTIEERLKVAHAISQIVSQRMVFRDQMEVIKLINPAAVLSPNTTEFSINLSHLNNRKLKRIKEYVRNHAFQHNDEIKNSSFHEFLLGNPKSSSSNCRPAKRKGRRCKSSYTNELKLREEKVIQQDRKEKQSGLFVQEKVIKLSNPEEDEEDVNILE